MNDLEAFCHAMDGQWIVERYEVCEDERLRVHYRSLSNPLITWSHLPLHFETVPVIGATGRICFVGEPYA